MNYALLEAQGITPWIPVFSYYKPEIEGCAYDKEADCFTCPAGKQLPFEGFASDPDGRLSKRYRASSRDYRRCPRKPTCTPKMYEAQDYAHGLRRAPPPGAGPAAAPARSPAATARR